ncbi:adenylate/guanylate cyclase domain-containing protein [Anaerolineales bacterium HSG25]|nr:adenylate/guanylate cyclase domain-containing protein [Anaerolineales bacterium HSG25]
MTKKPYILVVDDEPVIREVMEALLVVQGYELGFATNGLEALEKTTARPPDLILLDVMMPGMNGLQVCRHLKANETWRNIPIILVTALDGKSDMTKGIDAGADDFLNKPFDNLELLARVRSMLRIKQQYDLLEQQRQQLESALHMNEQFARVTAQHLEELEILHDVGLRLMNHLDLDSVLSLISQVTAEIVLESARCVMHLVSEDDQHLLPIVFSPKDNSKAIYPSVGIESIVWQVLQNRAIDMVPDVSTSSIQLEDDFSDMQSLLIVPLNDDQKTVGTLTVFGREANLFEPSHQHVLSILANQAVVAIMKARYFEERRKEKEREKQTIRGLFHRYVSPTVVDRLVDGVDDLVLGGKRQSISVLFADIRNFTSFSENLPPEKLVEVLNQYLALAVEAILADDGTLDKFMGDAVMAFFNAPLTQADHTLRAVRAAITMQQLIVDYNHTHASKSKLSFGVGIHVGPAVVGNIGTVQQMNYTAIGDTVNLAKRLQENAEGGQIIISQQAYDLVKSYVQVRDLGPLTVKGRAAIVHTYELLGCQGC